MKRLAIIALLVAACGGGAVTATQPATPTPTETPDATEAPPPDITGLGVITFGTALDEDTLLITKPTSKFKRTAKKIYWSAQFSETAGATSITFVIASKSASGAERGIIKTDTDVSDPGFDLFANGADIASLVDNKAGTYVMRYLRESTILAEGEFTLTK